MQFPLTLLRRPEFVNFSDILLEVTDLMGIYTWINSIQQQIGKQLNLYYHFYFCAYASMTGVMHNKAATQGKGQLYVTMNLCLSYVTYLYCYFPPLPHRISPHLCRPFRLPAILVGDGRLGGISATISAYESLKLRGYDVVAVVLEDQGFVNEVPLLSYLRDRYAPLTFSNDLLGILSKFAWHCTTSSAV